MLNEEYGFDLTDMERDFNIIYTDPDTGKNKKQKKFRPMSLWALLSLTEFFFLRKMPIS